MTDRTPAEQPFSAPERFARAVDGGAPAPDLDRELEVVAALRSIPQQLGPDDVARERMRTAILERLDPGRAAHAC